MSAIVIMSHRFIFINYIFRNLQYWMICVNVFFLKYNFLQVQDWTQYIHIISYGGQTLVSVGEGGDDGKRGGGVQEWTQFRTQDTGHR